MTSEDQIELRYDGQSYDPLFDNVRLTGQLARIYAVMKDGNWRTLDEIAGLTGAPPASVSAQLRHLRKNRFGHHTINKQSRGERMAGLFEYQLVLNPTYKNAIEMALQLSTA